MRTQGELLERGDRVRLSHYLISLYPVLDQYLGRRLAAASRFGLTEAVANQLCGPDPARKPAASAGQVVQTYGVTVAVKEQS